MPKSSLAIFLLIVIGLFFLLSSEGGENSGQKEMELIMAAGSTKEKSVHLIALMDKVGPVKAQEMLLVSGLPFTGETHLLIHYVGDYVYEKFGLEGLPYCRDYFLSACYHGFIINALAEFGLDGMTEVMRVCDTAGPGVSPQCAHGAGHGFVAWHDYDLVKGAEMCDALGAKLDTFPYSNCYDGVFMENVWGVHDGAPSDKRWVKEDEIYYPCTDPRIPEKYLGGCWSNQATLMYQYFRGDLRKTAEACDGVDNSYYRETCYNNLSRQIHPLTNGDVGKVVELCQNASGIDWQNYCINVNMISYWSVGDRVTPFEVCEIQSGAPRAECFERLAAMIQYQYGANPGEKKNYCDKIIDVIHRRPCEI